MVVSLDASGKASGRERGPGGWSRRPASPNERV